MAIPFLNDIDLNKNELQNAVIQSLGTAPLSPKAGQVYFNNGGTTAADKGLWWYNGTTWVRIGVTYDMAAGAVSSNKVPITLTGSDGTTDTVYIQGAGGATITQSNGTITITTAEAATATPIVAGTGAVGTSSKYAKEDHVHPAQTSVTGNAGSATQLQNARTIDGVSFNGTANISHFGSCTISGSTGTVACTGFTLAAGAWIAVYFPNSNNSSSSDPLQLNVNSTGGKNVKYYRGSDESIPANAHIFEINRTYLLVYDGTDYRLVGDLDTSVSYDSGTLAQLRAGTIEQDEVWTPKILHDYVAEAIGAANAMRFKGTVTTSSGLPTTGVKVGDTYMVNEAGTYAGQTCEVGDLIIATATTPTWTVAQTNINGAITSISGTSPVSVTGSGSSRTVGVNYTAVTGKPTGNQSPSFGDSVTISQISQSATGQITATDRTIKIPASRATSSNDGLMSKEDKAKLDLLAGGAVVVNNPALTSSNGVCRWEIIDLNEMVIGVVQVFDKSTGKQVMCDVKWAGEVGEHTPGSPSNQVWIDILSTTNIAANSYCAVIVGF